MTGMPSNPTERQPVHSSGRGGAGNMHPVQALFGPAVRQPDPDDYSSTRGRELADQRYKLTTIGRGGAGNTRTQSKAARATVEAAIRIEGRYIKERESKKGVQVYSTGRGGAGNVLRSNLHPDAYFSVTDGSPALNLEEEDKENTEGGEVSQYSGGTVGTATTHLCMCMHQPENTTTPAGKSRRTSPVDKMTRVQSLPPHSQSPESCPFALDLTTECVCQSPTT